MHLTITHCQALDPTDLVAAARAFKATDPRDKIYALLAFKPLSFHPLWCIETDYTKTIQEVYKLSVRACIMQSKKLLVLSHVNHPEYQLEMFVAPGKDLSRDGFPTWVPRWDSEERGGVIRKALDDGASKGLTTAYEADDNQYYKEHVRGFLPPRPSDEDDEMLEGEPMVMLPPKEPGGRVREVVPLDMTKSQDAEGATDAGRILPVIVFPKGPDNNVLKVRGIQVDTCTTGSIALQNSWWEFGANWQPVLLLLMQGLVRDNPDLLDDEEQKANTFEELAATLVAGNFDTIFGREDEEEVLVKKSAEAMLLFWKQTLAVMERAMEKTLPEEDLLGLPASSELNEEESVLAYNWGAEASRRTHNRRIFRTMNGHLGNGPAAMRCNDVIAVFYGGDMPFVLRPMGLNYQVVGPCYLHGFMHGQAVEWYKENVLEMEMFDLV